MSFLITLGKLYLLGGFVYALYIFIKKIDPWYHFPINMIGGPFILVYNLYLMATNKFPPGVRKDKR